MAPRDEDRLKIRLKFPDREKFARLYERELSRGGIFLRSPKVKPIGTPVDIQFLPGDATVGLALAGQVIHVVEPAEADAQGTASGMGVRFLDLDAGKRALIDAYVAGTADDFVAVEDAPDSDPAPAPTPPGGGAASAAAPALDPAAATTPAVAPPPSPAAPPRPEAPDRRPEEVDPAVVAEFMAELDAIEKPLKSGADCYALMGVHPDASPGEIKTAFLELKKRCHPDRFSARGTPAVVERANSIYSEINKAFLTLSQPGRRAAYNIMLGRYNARYATAEEEEAHRLASREFRRKYVERYAVKVSKAEKFARSARSEAAAGRVATAKNNLKLALSFDPLNEEYRELLIRLESGEAV